MTPTHEEIETLERLAKAAQEHQKKGAWWGYVHGYGFSFHTSSDGPETPSTDLVAYCSPDRILRMCARIRELEEDWSFHHVKVQQLDAENYGLKSILYPDMGEESK